MALSIASGFIVDDAIVMIENIVRYIEAGDSPLDAALKGSRQIGFTIVSLTISLVAVFIPLLLMGGIVGRLFREFAITLSVSVVISGVLSLILTPMMCAALLKPETPGERGRLFRMSERAFDAVRNIYEWGLRWSLRHQTITLTFTVLTFFASVWLYIIIPKGFVPIQDTGLIAGTTDAAPDVSFENMSILQQRIAKHHRPGPRRDLGESALSGSATKIRPSTAAGSTSTSARRIAGMLRRRRSWDRLNAAVATGARYIAAFAISAGHPDRYPPDARRNTSMSCRVLTKRSCDAGPTSCFRRCRSSGNWPMSRPISTISASR